MTACQDPECARLREELGEALVKATAELEHRRATVTTGGPPPPLTPLWTNPDAGSGLLPEFAHLAVDSPHASNARRSTDGE